MRLGRPPKKIKPKEEKHKDGKDEIIAALKKENKELKAQLHRVLYGDKR